MGYKEILCTVFKTYVYLNYSKFKINLENFGG